MLKYVSHLSHLRWTANRALVFTKVVSESDQMRGCFVAMCETDTLACPEIAIAHCWLQ